MKGNKMVAKATVSLAGRLSKADLLAEGRCWVGLINQMYDDGTFEFLKNGVAADRFVLQVGPDLRPLITGLFSKRRAILIVKELGTHNPLKESVFTIIGIID
jgi:hypothetical protein